jgi:hypothetical protein
LGDTIPISQRRGPHAARGNRQGVPPFLGPVPEPYMETSRWVDRCFPVRTIRVILGRLGSAFRLSAPELDIVVDGDTIAGAWHSFLEAVRGRDDTAWLAFDVGPTRRDEVEQGLDAPDDEDWAEPVGKDARH